MRCVFMCAYGELPSCDQTWLAGNVRLIQLLQISLQMVSLYTQYIYLINLFKICRNDDINIILVFFIIIIMVITYIYVYECIYITRKTKNMLYIFKYIFIYTFIFIICVYTFLCTYITLCFLKKNIVWGCSSQVF